MFPRSKRKYPFEKASFRLLQEEWLPWPSANTFAWSWTVSTNVLTPQILLIHILASTRALILFRKKSTIRWLQVPLLLLLLTTMIAMAALMMSRTACLSMADPLYKLFILSIYPYFNANKESKLILCLQHQLRNTTTDNTTTSLPSYRELYSHMYSTTVYETQTTLYSGG